MAWHYTKEGKRYGPVTEAELLALIKAGSLGPRDLVWRPGLDSWSRAGDLAELFPPPPLPGELPAVEPPSPSSPQPQDSPTQNTAPSSGGQPPDKREETGLLVVANSREQTLKHTRGEGLVAESVRKSPEGLQAEQPMRQVDGSGPQMTDANRLSTLGPSLPTRWLTFYTAVRLPLGALMWLGAAFVIAGQTGSSGFGFVSISVLALVALIIATAVGLAKRTLWGWRLNNVLLGVELFLTSYAKCAEHAPPNLAVFVVFLVALGLVWTLPNLIYFWKRRPLFGVEAGSTAQSPRRFGARWLLTALGVVVAVTLSGVLVKPLVLDPLRKARVHREADQAMSALPFYRELKQADPSRYQSILNFLCQGLERGEPVSKISVSLSYLVWDVMKPYLPTASDEALLTFVRREVILLTVGLDRDPEALFVLIYGGGDKAAAYQALSLGNDSDTQEAMTAIVRTGAAKLGRPVNRIRGQKLIESVVLKLFPQYGRDLAAFSDPLDSKVPHAKVCEMLVAYYKTILSLPPDQAADALRYAFSEVSQPTPR